jgi:hypothetical protein
MKERLQKDHYRLFLASPGDVKPERDAVVEVVNSFNQNNKKNHIDVIRWENYSTPNLGRPQQVIFENTSFHKTDIFVGIFWARIGSPTGKINPETNEEYISGTLEELSAAVKLLLCGKIKVGRFMLYFCTRPVPQNEANQFILVNKLRKDIENNKSILFKTYESTENFKYEFSQHLNFYLNPGIKSNLTHTNFGRNAYKTCNREFEVSQFLSCFETSCSDYGNKPQFYFINGDIKECHSSFIDRLMDIELKNYVQQNMKMKQASIISQLVYWPQIEGTSVERQSVLVNNLFKTLSPSSYVIKKSAMELIRLPNITKNPLVVIQHNISISEWDKYDESLLKWYIETYWGEVKSFEDVPLFIIFFNIKYSEIASKRKFKIFRWNNNSLQKKKIKYPFFSNQ